MGDHSNYSREPEELLGKALELRDQLGEIPKMDHLRKVLGIGAPKARKIIALMEARELASNDRIARSESDFEPLKGSDGLWSARDLMDALGYARWENFVNVIEEAMISCEVAGGRPDDNFREVRKINTGARRDREVSDYRVTRLAAYLIAMAGDPRKEPIALARMYFAQREVERVQREQSPMEQHVANHPLTRMMAALASELTAHDYRITGIEARTESVEGAVHSVHAEVQRATARLDDLQARNGWMTTLGYVRLRGLPSSDEYGNRLGRRAAKLTRAMGEEPAKVYSERWGAVNSYPLEALDQAMKEI